MPLVMLKRDWPANFRRTIRDKHGKAVQVLEFVPGVAVEVTAKQLDSLSGDMGHALLPARRDAKQKVRIITDDVVAEGVADGADAG